MEIRCVGDVHKYPTVCCQWKLEVGVISGNARLSNTAEREKGRGAGGASAEDPNSPHFALNLQFFALLLQVIKIDYHMVCSDIVQTYPHFSATRER